MASTTRKRRFFQSGNDWCPLCTKGLALGTASLEHAPPKSMGNTGPGNVLVCKECNNAWGRGAEAWMDRERRHVGHIKLLSDDKQELMLAGEFRQGQKFAARPREHHIGITRLSKGLTPGAGTGSGMVAIAPPGLNQLAARRAWIKSMYLSIGAATQGGFWRTQLGRQTREALEGNEAPHSFYVQRYKDAFDERRLFRFEGEEPAYMMVWSDMILVCGIERGVSPSTEDGLHYDFALRDSVSMPVSFGRPSWRDFNRLPPPSYGGRFSPKGQYGAGNALMVRLGHDIVEEASVAPREEGRNAH